MKTSNIILVTLIGSITLVIITGAFQLRLTGAKKENYLDKIYSEETLPVFKYLMINQSMNLNIIHSHETKIEIYSPQNDGKPQVLYHRQGDTLVIDHIKMGPRQRTLYVNLKTEGKKLEYVHASDAAFTMSGFTNHSLILELNNSSLQLNDSRNLRIGTLTINGAQNSQIETGNVQIDTLKLYLNQSTANLPGVIYKLEGSMENNSKIDVKNAALIAFKKDSSSQLQ